MAVNRYQTAQTYQGSLYTPPVDLVAAAMEHLQQRYDKNFAIANEIKNNFIPSLPQDRAVANEMQKTYEKKIDDIVNGYGGDYSQASEDLNKLLYSIKKDYGPGGKANAIISNFQNYQDWRKQSQELIEKGKVLGEDLNLADRYYMEEYKGIGNFDPVTGSYNRFSPDTLTEYVNPDKVIQEVYKNFKPQKYKIGRTVFKNGKQIYTEQETEGITPERLYPSFATALGADPKFGQYVAQKAKFLRQSTEDSWKYLDAYTQQRARDLSYMNTSDIQKAERDPLFLLREKQRLKDESDKKMMGAFMSQYQYDPTVEAVSRKKSSIDPLDWRGAGVGTRTEYTGNLWGPLIATGSAEDTNRMAKMNFKDAINDKEYLDRTHLNKHLAQAVFDNAKSALPPGVYEKKYGKDKQWTANFDEQVVREYNKNEASHSRFQGKSIRIASPEAREQIQLELAGRLGDPSQTNVYAIGSQAEQSAADLGISAKQLLTKDNKLRKDVDISYVLPGPGYAAAGFRVTTDKGTFIFPDNNMDRRELSNELAGGFNPLFFGNEKTGNPLRIGSTMVNGKPQDVWATPEIDYIKRGDKYDEEISFNVMGIDDKGNLVPTGKKLSGRDTDIYDRYLPGFEGALGAGASRKDFQMFTLMQYLNGYE